MKLEPKKVLSDTKQWIRNDAVMASREFWLLDMRWSYLITGVLVIIGAIVNFILPHGWTVWPFVAAAMLMMTVHEAAERNGQGVPPLHVYALFAGAIIVWIVVMMVLSVTNPLILVLGIAGLGYYCGKAYLKQRERDRVREQRRAEGKCVHCGEVADYNLGVCMNCGNDPDPSASQLSRVASIVHGSNNTARARAVIKGETLAQVATLKEKHLLASRQRDAASRKPAARKK